MKSMSNEIKYDQRFDLQNKVVKWNCNDVQN